MRSPASEVNTLKLNHIAETVALRQRARSYLLKMKVYPTMLMKTKGNLFNKRIYPTMLLKE